MDLSERQTRIVALFRQHGEMSVDALADHFGVATQTIRRDVNTLCDANVLRRYHGGARLMTPGPNQPYEVRRVRNLEGKLRIGQAAAERIPDGATVLLGIGTTPEQVAVALVHRKRLSVITNNLRAALVLASNPEHRVIVPGGELRSPNPEILGDEADRLFRAYRADVGVYSVGGIDDDGTLLDYDRYEAASREALRDASRYRILVADSYKFSRKPSVRGGQIDEQDLVVTDGPLPDPLREHLRSRSASSGTPASPEILIA
ncbi:DeoR/GlpR family DNA-binding transcription regulator [Pandoraea apista]|uniref:DeoR family transcriptional regulator n=1 Tax=Pandoraea apista TaxID=93218 RepID=A0A0D5W913_9BURK|nr:DeoR/GlpR family DNA-binding transcription regulator [Pandoraea apista]AJZ74851.1 DeoR faimly transcriptional regulator [Pandoraea apista]AKH73388.1 DeoR faimly transcriptional regulator [Pandoraea apista]AKI61934.1 DeoR faimly transcriptional regulator [Pandoraea apista]ALS64932.1 DeoR family transcriptional regulator [Pandoraea apista]AVF40204.1 DeoR/GlpR transcriptional regulator [Pandoraea apista]